MRTETVCEKNKQKKKKKHDGRLYIKILIISLDIA